MKPALLIILSVLASAQTASVYELSVSDAGQGKRLYDDKIKADKAYDAWVEMARKKYSASGLPIEFSSDFKYAVPVVAVTECGNCGTVSLNHQSIKDPMDGTFKSPLLYTAQ
jgi:hypothetical protein